MAVRPAQNRIDKWNLKLEGEALSVVTGKQKQKMLDQVSVMFPLLETLENDVKLILAEAGTSTIMNPAYLDFGRQVFRLVRRFSGGQLINETNVVLNRWVAEGCDQDTLEKIRDTVYTMAPPAP